MTSESHSDSEGESNLVIVTSTKPVDTIKKEEVMDNHTNLYSDDVIENLWNARAMGCDGPDEILLTLWYFISHYFGIRSRTDHAKLLLGNVNIELENNTKKIIFKKHISSIGKDICDFTTKFPSRPITENTDNKDRCPIIIFEKYLNHRPSNFSYPSSPFYLQPDKSFQHDGDGPWYAAAGLGKNRIGSLFNSALSRCGQPTVRHYTSRRQIISDPSSCQQSLPILKSVVDNSPKIKLKISHLSSGNPIVTQTLSNESGAELIKPKLRSASNRNSVTRKRSADGNKEVKVEPIIDTDTSQSCTEPSDFLDVVKTEMQDIPMTKYLAKPAKRVWTLQKTIVNITSKEPNPINRQIMMQLSMNKDILTAADNKISGANCPKARLLRRGVKLSHLQLPQWPTIDKFCDSELQRSMQYSFDNDSSGHKDDSDS